MLANGQHHLFDHDSRQVLVTSTTRTEPSLDENTALLTQGRNLKHAITEDELVCGVKSLNLVLKLSEALVLGSKLKLLRGLVNHLSYLVEVLTLKHGQSESTYDFMVLTKLDPLVELRLEALLGLSQDRDLSFLLIHDLGSIYLWTRRVCIDLGC